MANCGLCKQDMQKVDSCIAVPFVERKGGKKISHQPIRYGSEPRFQEIWKTFPLTEDKRCHDCNVLKGGVHHPGCDMEECPICHRQAIGCDCQVAEEASGS